MSQISSQSRCQTVNILIAHWDWSIHLGGVGSQSDREQPNHSPSKSTVPSHFLPHELGQTCTPKLLCCRERQRYARRIYPFVPRKLAQIRNITLFTCDKGMRVHSTYCGVVSRSHIINPDSMFQTIIPKGEG